MKTHPTKIHMWQESETGKITDITHEVPQFIIDGIDSLDPVQKFRVIDGLHAAKNGRNPSCNIDSIVENKNGSVIFSSLMNSIKIAYCVSNDDGAAMRKTISGLTYDVFSDTKFKSSELYYSVYKNHVVFIPKDFYREFGSVPKVDFNFDMPEALVYVRMGVCEIIDSYYAERVGRNLVDRFSDSRYKSNDDDDFNDMINQQDISDFCVDRRIRLFDLLDDYGFVWFNHYEFAMYTLDDDELENLVGNCYDNPKISGGGD